MDHVAIDLGGRESQICVRDDAGTILEEKRHPTKDLRAYLSRRPKSRVVMETCAEGFHVADQAVELGHDVRVVPATLAPSLGVGARRTKTDKRDARTLSEVSCRVDLPSVHIPSQRSRELKTILGMHASLTRVRTKLINTVRGFMRQRAVQLPKAAYNFAGKVREALKLEQPTDESSVLDRCLWRQLEVIDTVEKEIEEAEKEIKALAKQDPVCPRLMSIPGIGPITSLWFVAVIDDITRFKCAHDCEAYLGVTPGERSSSDRRQRTGITKAGSTDMRRCLVQAAWAARRTHGVHPMLDWTLEVEKRRGKRVAVLALARKLAGIMFALWRTNRLYDPNLGAKPLPTP